MRKKRKDLPILEKVTILDAAAEGKAIAKVDDLVIFVPFTAPGDIVDIKLLKKKRNFAEGRAIRFHSYSEKRVDPVCSYFGTCGGCKWQHLRYEEQLAFKQKQVEDAFQRIGKFEHPPLLPILASNKTYFYRNKLEFSFSDKRWLTGGPAGFEDEPVKPALGFHIPQIYDKVLDIEQCHLQEDPSNQIRNRIRDFALQNELSFYNVKRWDGLLRNLIIRNTSTGEWMVIMVFHHEDEWVDKVMEFIRQEFPLLTSLLYVINPKQNDDISDLRPHLHSGRWHLEEWMPSHRNPNKLLQFRIGPQSFFQTNYQQAYKLYKTAADFAELKDEDIVYDLYSGTGTIANYIAYGLKKVVGLEYVNAAVEDARENSRVNQLENTVFFAGDIAKIFNEELITREGKPNVIITDPPRAGMHEKVIKQIIAALPERLVYVSCNPATQARDIALLSEAYRVTKVQPVDMFPHTQHVECVVGMERNL